jgi:hypothetical protein
MIEAQITTEVARVLDHVGDQEVEQHDQHADRVERDVAGRRPSGSSSRSSMLACAERHGEPPLRGIRCGRIAASGRASERTPAKNFLG